MSHWIEDAEKRGKNIDKPSGDSARIQDKKFRIRQNYQKNKPIYDGFIKKMNSLIDRVNQLPIEHREEFGKINSSEKKSHLDNKLWHFSSSRRYHKRVFKSLLQPFSSAHFKHVRLIYFNVAKLPDKAEVEIREEHLEKKRLDGMLVDSEHSSFKEKKGMPRLRKIYYYPMDRLNDDLAFRIVDWLAFHEGIEHLPFLKDGEERPWNNE